MPLVTRAHDLPLDAELQERLTRLLPPVPVSAPSADALLYVGWFNTKPIAAAWATGPAEGRQLVDFGIHPATRGREVLAQLAHGIRDHENAAGRRVLSAEDYSQLDSLAE